MDTGGASPKGHGSLPPINLALLPRRGFKPQERPVRLELDFAEGRHESLHRLVTAGVAAARPQFLVQNPRRVIDVGRTGPHHVGMGGQQRLCYRRPAIGLLRRLP